MLVVVMVVVVVLSFMLPVGGIVPGVPHEAYR